MKNLTLLLLVVGTFVFSSKAAKAQQMTLFECLPLACSDTVGPTQSGIALVIAHAECDDGVLINRQGSVNIGVPLPCILPLEGFVNFSKTTDTFFDDCGELDFVDSMVGTLEVFDFFDDLVFDGSSDDDCAGGQGAEVHGVLPCGLIDD